MGDSHEATKTGQTVHQYACSVERANTFVGFLCRFLNWGTG